MDWEEVWDFSAQLGSVLVGDFRPMCIEVEKLEVCQRLRSINGVYMLS